MRGWQKTKYKQCMAKTIYINAMIQEKVLSDAASD